MQITTETEKKNTTMKIGYVTMHNIRENNKVKVALVKFKSRMQ